MGCGQWKGRTLERGPFGRVAEGVDQAESPAAAAAGAGESEEEPESPDELPLLPLDELEEDADSEAVSLLSSFSTGRLGRP